MDLVVVSRVFFLKVARILEHDRAQINGRGGGINRAVEPLLHQPRDVAAMVEVRVRQDDGFNLIRRNGRGLPVTLAPLFLPLKEAAVDEDLNACTPSVARDVE